ncbi:hypothetical protein P2318_30530 [Myxococcaceae bacterium GXIMD 01537]
MRSSPSHPRGMALVMAMIVIVLMTLLVAGAITFTGTERGAAMLQTDEDAMSTCTQAARNLFIARLRVLTGNAERIQFNQEINHEGRRIFTGHFDQAGASIISAKWVPPNNVGEARTGAIDLSNRVGTSALVAGYYRVTAVCRESNPVAGSTSPPREREVEFVVRMGL